MAKDLGEYRQKRDFKSTSEPSGKARSGRRQGAPRFVIQQHDASSLHWDLRLEKDGVMVSWALPKGIPQHPKANRLAVHTEDHPLDYAGFEGVIPEGQYGAGTMEVWDRGTFDEEKFRKDEVIVVLHGERVQGRYVLFQTKRQELDDPPHGPAVGPGPGADARGPPADDGGHGAAARRVSASPTRSSGTGSGSWPTASTGTCASRAATEMT